MSATDLLRFAQEGDLDQVSNLLALGANANTTTLNGQTALFLAAKLGHDSVVSLLLKYQADANIADDMGWTPLIAAAVSENTLVCSLLLHANANPNCATDQGMSPLYIAAASNNDALVKLLLEYNASIDFCTQVGKSPIEAAIKKQNTSIMQMLIHPVDSLVQSEKVADISTPSSASSFIQASPALSDQAERTSLIDAIEKNDIATIVKLIKANVDVNQTASDGTSPLCLASFLNHDAIVGMLLIAGADVNKSNGLGNTPLTIAAANGNQVILKMLLNDGVDVNATDMDGSTPLIQAVQHGHEDIVQILLNQHAHAAQRNKNGDTALILAVKTCRRQVTNLLYNAIAQPPTKINPSEIQVVEQLSSVGQTYLVEHAKYNGVDVAIKSVPDRRNNRILQAEINTLTTCNSPYLLTLLGVAGSTERPQMVSEFMDMGNVHDYLGLKSEGKHTKDFGSHQILWVIANALLDLHEKGFVHRDLRSENVLLCSKNYIKLANLGDTEANLVNFTMKSLIWCAPEVLVGGAYTSACDVYSFGIIMTELDTLKAPYWDANLDMWALTDNIRKGTIRPTLSSNCEPWYAALAEKCLAFDPAVRPTAQVIVETLQARWTPSKANDAPNEKVNAAYSMFYPKQSTVAGLNDVE